VVRSPIEEKRLGMCNSPIPPNTKISDTKTRESQKVALGNIG